MHAAAALRRFVITDFKLRYQGSVLGYLWSLLKPLVMFTILYVVFGLVLRLGDSVPHYPVYLLLGLLLWNYFTEVTSVGLRSIVENGELIRKLSFPRYTIVLAGSVSAFVNLGISLLVFAGFVVVSGVDLHWRTVFFPLILLELFVLAIGVAFLLSALFVVASSAVVDPSSFVRPPAAMPGADFTFVVCDGEFAVGVGHELT
ncbi:ABC transporter permease [Aestuariimicrobium sp. Y1814]|uniref:ABC transporter permease n=1 Tax=Aestuariimicrobium sp. Y1814 TaxID=3418742 RepID=UPI003DA756FB